MTRSGVQSSRWAGALASLVIASLTCGDVVIRRGEAGELRGTVVIGEAGVTVRTDIGARQLIPWDRVREVRMDNPVPGLDSHLRTAEDLWRARSRLERGDATLAEPLFTELFSRFRGQTHETALVVAEGLLRCALARGAQAEAVLPALETIRMRRSGVTTDSFVMLPQVVDPTAELCIQLAPFWVADRTLLRVETDLVRYNAQGDRVVETMALLLLQSVRRTLGRPDSAGEPLTLPDHPGLAYLQKIIDCSASDAPARRKARADLLARMADLPVWSRAWAQMAVGSSLLAETDESTRQEGLVHLAHLPARHAADQPFLAGLALSRMRDALDAQGDSAAVESIDTELARRFPGHPVLRRPTTTPVSQSNVRGGATIRGNS